MTVEPALAMHLQFLVRGVRNLGNQRSGLGVRQRTRQTFS